MSQEDPSVFGSSMGLGPAVRDPGDDAPRKAIEVLVEHSPGTVDVQKA